MEIEKWLDEVIKEATITTHHLDLYKKLTDILNSNEELRKMDNTILLWMRDAFTTDLVISIGRLCDRDRRSLSFVRFLEELKNHPEYLTRERHVKFYAPPKPDPVVSFGDMSFDDLAGPGQQIFSTDLITADITRITEQDPIKKILTYRHQHVAHSDKEQQEAPTYDELFEAFNIVENVIKKYTRLLRAQHYTQFAPVMQSNWEEVFTIPWIKMEKIAIPQLSDQLPITPG